MMVFVPEGTVAETWDHFVKILEFVLIIKFVNINMLIHDKLLDGNGYFYPICHHVQDIHCRSVHDLDLDI